MSNEFKAGDFTSGKMGEIFKTCCFQDLAIINHKQLGCMYLIPEDVMRDIVVNLFFYSDQKECIVSYIKSQTISAKMFKSMYQADQLRLFSEFCRCDFKSWLDALIALSAVLKTGKYEYENAKAI